MESKGIVKRSESGSEAFRCLGQRPAWKGWFGEDPVSMVGRPAAGGTGAVYKEGIHPPPNHPPLCLPQPIWIGEPPTGQPANLPRADFSKESRPSTAVHASRQRPRYQGIPAFCDFFLTTPGEALIRFARGRIAQSGEHRPYKPGVAGSNPVPPTSKISGGPGETAAQKVLVFSRGRSEAVQHAGLSRRRSRVQIPSSPPDFEKI